MALRRTAAACWSSPTARSSSARGTARVATRRSCATRPPARSTAPSARGGIAQAPIAGRSVQAQDLALTADGHVVVVGISKVGSATDTTVVRFTSSGQPDTTFPAGNSNGTVTFDVGNGLNEFPTAVTLDSTGHIIVTGNVSTMPAGRPTCCA